MQPPWIISFFFLISFAASGTASVDGEQGANSTMSRKQRETYERERRLIPYMTYYIAPSLTTRTSPEARGILVPIATPRENIYQIHAFPKISLPAVQNDNSQQVHILPKPVLRVQSPPFLPSAIQAGKQESGIPPQIYGTGNQYTDSGVTGPSIGPQGHTQRIQSESRPLQIIKIHPGTTEQKFTAPQLLKVIPIITKLSSAERSSKSFALPPHQYSFSTPKIPPTLPQSSSFNEQNFHKGHASLHNQNSFQGNIIYANHDPPKDGRLTFIDSTIASDKNEYTLAKITLSSTTPSPYDDIQFKVSGGGAPVALPNADALAKERLTPVSPIPEGYNGGQLSTVSSFSGGKYVSIPSGRPQVYYVQKANSGINHEGQDLLQTQNSQLPKLRVPLEEKIRFVATVTPIPVTNDLESTQWKIRQEVPREQNYEKQTLNTISSLLKETNKLPQNLTPHNIDAGIKTLALILERLQQQQNHQNADKSLSVNTSTSQYSAADNEKEYKNPKKVHSFPEKSGTSTPGRPGIDYPIYSTIPQTNFDCSTQRYKGFFGDPDTNCQVWHYCDLNGGQASFLCPNGTIFSQVALTCDWWFNVKCASTSQLVASHRQIPQPQRNRKLRQKCQRMGRSNSLVNIKRQEEKCNRMHFDFCLCHIGGKDTSCLSGQRAKARFADESITQLFAMNIDIFQPFQVTIKPQMDEDGKQRCEITYIGFKCAFLNNKSDDGKPIRGLRLSTKATTVCQKSVTKDQTLNFILGSQEMSTGKWLLLCFSCYSHHFCHNFGY